MQKTFSRKLKHRRLAKGFTLIELMIVVAIVAILTAIAYPSYTHYIVKTRRTAAKACLSEFSNFMERYYTTNMKYTGATNPNFDCESTAQTGNFYAYAFVGTPDASTYKISATPKAAQPDAECGTLTLDQKGTRTPTTTGCW